jgi:hypothetical protein
MPKNTKATERAYSFIVGHEKPRITYGFYSGGARLSVKAEAIERIRYPGL